LSLLWIAWMVFALQIDMTVDIGDLLRLSGRTRHGKNRLREHGSVVEVIHLRLHESKFCVNHKDGDSWRWIDIPEDEHMEWEIIDKNDKNHIATFN